MTNPVEARALFALYRNHPSTLPSERYGPQAHRRARQNRTMLLVWAAKQSDDALLSCRNLGVTSLAWIRAASVLPVPFTTEEWLRSHYLRLTGEQIDSITPPPDGDWSMDWDEYEDFVPLHGIELVKAEQADRLAQMHAALVEVIDSSALDPDEFLSLDRMCRRAIGTDWPYLTAGEEPHRG